jgi:hypothetical protein
VTRLLPNEFLFFSEILETILPYHIRQKMTENVSESSDRTVLFGEYNCKGPGASTKQRVPWSRTLTYDEARPFIGRSFINGEQWLRL